MFAIEIAALCFVSLLVLIYLAILIYLHCFGKIYRHTFPSPPPTYTEKFFGEKLKYANVLTS